MSERQRPVLVYDGDCAFCTKCVAFLEDHLPYQPDIVAWQFADLQALGLTAAACERAVQWVEPNGATWAGAAGIGRLLVRCGGWWRPMGWLCLYPPTSWMAAGVYRLIAANRHRLPGGTAACAMPAHLRPGAQRAADQDPGQSNGD